MKPTRERLFFISVDEERERRFFFGEPIFFFFRGEASNIYMHSVLDIETFWSLV